MHAILVVMALLAQNDAPGGDEWSEFQTLAKDRDPDQRCKGIDLIKKHKNLQMVQALLPLLADAHPRVRYRATRAIGDANDPAALDLLIKTGLKHGDHHVRQHTAEALGWIKEDAAADPLIALLQDSDPNVRAQAADALAWLRAKKAVDALLAVFERDRAWEARAWALDAVGRLDASRAAEAVERALADKACQIRMEAMMVAPKVSKEAGLKAFKVLIGDADWRVRVQAIEGALEVRHRECVGALIDLFVKEKGRLRLDIYLALQDLTGKELGLDPKPWKTWWEANKDSFEPVAAAKGRGGAGFVPDSAGATKAEFFRVPILSNRVAFILDLSGSMRDDAPGAKKESKLNVAQRGMVKTISDFALDAWFNIVLLGCDKDGTYRKDQQIWKKKLMQANDAGKRDAIKFVNSTEAKGWTNIWDGIDYAFEDEEVDTIYLYSDGGASRGVWTLTGEILMSLDRMNRFRKIMIFTVETPGTKPNTADNIKLLQQLAEHTKGTYKLAETK